MSESKKSKIDEILSATLQNRAVEGGIKNLIDLLQKAFNDISAKCRELELENRRLTREGTKLEGTKSEAHHHKGTHHRHRPKMGG